MKNVFVNRVILQEEEKTRVMVSCWDDDDEDYEWSGNQSQ